MPLNVLQMPIYALSDTTGLTEWIDYIPVQQETAGAAGVTDDDGYLQSVNVLSDNTGLVAWVDYIPVYEVTGRTKPWHADSTGYIPYDEIGAVTSPFTPEDLFASGEVGAWYDPSDLDTMFQDSAGTTPVTAVEQSVGLIQDKSGNGNHASQTTAASRPILRARYNYFEGFSGNSTTQGSWNCLNAVASVEGTLTNPVNPSEGVSLITANAVTGAAVYARVGAITVVNGQSYTGSVYVRPGTDFRYYKIGFKNPAGMNGNLIWDMQTLTATTYTSSSANITDYGYVDVGNGWYRFWWTVLSAVDGLTYVYVQPTTSNAGTLTPTEVNVTTDGSETFHICNPMASPGTTLYPYQWITSATVYDDDPDVWPYYIEFDGVDDSLVTDTTITIAAESDLSVAFGGYAYADDVGGNIDVGYMYTTSASGGVRFSLAGNAVTSIFAATGPNTWHVNVAQIESGVDQECRTNGVVSDTDAIAATPAISDALALGSRSGTVRGHTSLNQCVLIDRLFTSQELSDLETYIAGKIGVTL